MSHYDIHVCDVIKYPEMVMARTVISSSQIFNFFNADFVADLVVTAGSAREIKTSMLTRVLKKAFMPRFLSAAKWQSLE